MTRKEYIERFVKHMVAVAGSRFDDGSSIEEYAIDTAPSYFDDFDDLSPEEAAEEDMYCWGED